MANTESLSETDLDAIFDSDGVFGAPIPWDDLSASAGRIYADSRLLLETRMAADEEGKSRLLPGDFEHTDSLTAGPNPVAETDLTGLRHLIFLRDGDTASAQEIEEFLGHTPSIRSLDLQWRVRPTDQLNLECLREPAILENLRINGDQLRELSRLRPFTNLRRLDVGWTVFDEFSALADCKKLQSLGVKGGSDVRGIGHLTELRRLSLEDPKSLSSFRGLNWPSIQSINVCGGSVRGISDIRRFEKLSRLVLAVTGVRDLSPLTNVSSIRELKIDHANGDLDLTPLGSLDGLESLSLTQRGAGNWFERMRFLGGLSEVRSLFLSAAHGEVDIGSIASLPNLERVSIAAPRGRWVERMGELDPRIDTQFRAFDSPADPPGDELGISIYPLHGEWVVSWRARPGYPRPDSVELYVMGILRDSEPHLFDRVEFDSESEMFSAVVESESDAGDVAQLAREFLRSQG